ncbi:hypothetical protein, partial [Allocoleopsis sp.]|uniref:hypothetical protein n=1 Tax=Allocoleopsis sp. TaxID=3088169 RepID=UPI002FD4F190
MTILLVLLFAVCFIACMALTRGLFLRLSNWNLLDRLIAASTPLVIFILCGLILREFVSTPFRSQNASILAPTVGIIY